MLVTLVIILSKAVGFGRDMVTTAYFGRTMENDAYVSAYSLFYLPFGDADSAVRGGAGEVQPEAFQSLR